MKRHKSLRILSSDHHHGLSAAKKLKASRNLENPELEKLAEEFRFFFNSQLLNHFSIEEELLASRLKDNPLIIKMCAEHVRMKEMLDSLSGKSSLKDKLCSLGELLEEHIRFEEKELFPFIEAVLTEEEFEEIGRLIEAHRLSK